MPKEPEMMNENQPNILFIASNIPTPKRKSNRIILTIANRLAGHFDISIMHPSELAPFPISLIKKYKNISGRNKWKDGNIDITPFKYLRLPTIKLSFIFLRLYKQRVKRFCEKYGVPQLIHSHFVLPDGYFAFLMKRLYGIPYIVSVRCTDVMNMDHLNKKSGIFNKYMSILNEADHLIVHNRFQYDYLQNLGIQSTVFSHGIEKEFFENKVIKQNDTVTISSIAELIPQKNINWVIRALKEYNGIKKTRLIIAGNGPIRKELEEDAEGIDATFTGHIPNNEIKKLLSSSQIFALPSINETFGLVFLEATARHNAVISLKNSGVWGHFKQNDEMMFCDSYETFKSSLFKLIDNENIRDEMARKSYAKSLSNYTWESVIKRYQDLYNEIIG